MYIKQVVRHLYLSFKFRIEHRKRKNENIHVIFMIFEVGTN
jgi:hypothetical protein